MIPAPPDLVSFVSFWWFWRLSFERDCALLEQYRTTRNELKLCAASKAICSAVLQWAEETSNRDAKLNDNFIELGPKFVILARHFYSIWTGIVVGSGSVLYGVALSLFSSLIRQGLYWMDSIVCTYRFPLYRIECPLFWVLYSKLPLICMLRPHRLDSLDTCHDSSSLDTSWV